LNCQLCKRGRKTIKKALSRPTELECAFYSDQHKCRTCKLGLSTIENSPAEILAADSPWSWAGFDTSHDSKPYPCEIALRIFDGEEPLAVLELIAEDMYCFNEKDAVLLRDLAQLAANALINSRKHWKMSQEKMSMDQILSHLRPFVPETVQRIVEKNPAAPSLEKKDVDVSILFLDVAGYTKISEKLTKEQVSFIIEKYFSSFLDVIYAHDGDINETAGDGLMVIFQGTEEENALNATKAALEVRIRTLDINRELEGRFEPILVNMGVNSGTASVGMTQFNGTSGTRMTFTASGPMTNLAARIAASTKEGDILLGPETARRVNQHIPLHDRGPKSFKNVQEKIRVFSPIHREKQSSLCIFR
jgi:class 3 adenylate cyclase